MAQDHVDEDGRLNAIRLINSGRFQTRADCLELAAAGCPEVYSTIAREHLEATAALAPPMFLFMAAISRARGLHEAILRELEADNPHAVLPLIRGFGELLTVVMYTLKKPGYIDVLLGIDDQRFRRKSFEAMFHVLRDEAAGLKEVYGMLSEYAHFGPMAIFNVQSIEDEGTGAIQWQDAPRWRDDQHFRTACAHTFELAMAARVYLGKLGDLTCTHPSVGKTA